MTELARAVLSLLRALFGRSRDGAFLRSRFGPWTMFLVCIVIGLARHTLSVELGVRIHAKWYVWDRDVVFTMAFFSCHLLFVGVTCVHALLRATGWRGDFRSLAAFYFHLQILHLLVPFLDIAGLQLGLPFLYNLGSGSGFETKYWLSLLVMTPGIVAVWLITMYATARVLLGFLEVSLRQLLPAATGAFAVLLVPIYFAWPTFNTLFNRYVHFDPNDPLAVWGYGTYFLVTSLLGLAYFRRQLRTGRATT